MLWNWKNYIRITLKMRILVLLAICLLFFGECGRKKRCRKVDHSLISEVGKTDVWSIINFNQFGRIKNYHDQFLSNFSYHYHFFIKLDHIHFISINFDQVWPQVEAELKNSRRSLKLEFCTKGAICEKFWEKLFLQRHGPGLSRHFEPVSV